MAFLPVISGMRYIPPPSRPGMTAIAAAIALSSTPLFAQDAAPVDAAPVIVTPPPVVTPPAVVTSTPAASTATTVPVLNVAPPVITPRAVPAAPAAVATRTEPTVTRSAPAPRAVRPAAPVAAPAAAPVTRTTAPVEIAPAPAPTPVAEAPAPVAAPLAPRAAPADGENDVLPLAGGLAAAVLLMGGALYAMNRPRRRDEDEDDVIVTETLPTAAAAPAFVAPVAAPMPSHAFAADPVGPTTAIPAGFDVSRFGRHTQAAYRGPTADNPFLSLRRRLKRASFLDGRERMAAQAGQQPAPRSDSWMPEARPAAARQVDHVTTRVSQPPRPGFRPAYS